MVALLKRSPKKQLCHFGCRCCLDSGLEKSAIERAGQHGTPRERDETLDVVEENQRLSWDDYFMSIAFLNAMRSKDPTMQVGACIVNAKHLITGAGYNGMPSNIPDERLPWSKVSDVSELHTKHVYVTHAELNAVLNSHSESCVGSTLYTTLFPCGECARLIIQSGISCVVYASDKHRARPSTIASRSMLGHAGVTLRHHVPAKCELRVAVGGGNVPYRISLFLAHAARLLDLRCALRPGSSEVSCTVGRSLRTSCLVTFCIGLMLGRWWPTPLRTST